jgi:regulator of protease activity HflC (stomatin/prohibitin superfamily)
VTAVLFMVLFLVAGVVCLVRPHLVLHHPTSKEPAVTFPVWILGVVFLALFLLIGLTSSIQTVGARQVGIPETFGTLGDDLQPGLHLVAPWTVVHTCSLGQQQSIQSQTPTEGDREGNDGVNINGNDQGSGVADVSVLYHFDPAHAEQIYRRYACDPELVKSNLIRQATRSAIGSAAATFPSTDLKSNRAQISAKALDTLDRTLKGYGVLVDNIVISDITLSQATQAAADAKLAAQQAAEQAKLVLQKAQVDAQTARVNADAEKVANDAKNASLTAAVLCAQWIDALKVAKPSVVNTGGPCGGVSAGGSVIVQTRTP